MRVSLKTAPVFGLTLGLATIATAAPPPAASRGSSPEAGHRATAGQGSDKDNYIDIVLAGQAAAVRRITGVEIPASRRYSPSYNPGGPGNDPTPACPTPRRDPASSGPCGSRSRTR